MNSRPPVSVVMPFAGDHAAAERALASLRGLRVRPGDELILAFNDGEAPEVRDGGVIVVLADGERSPAHARNAGAARAGGEWILFLDADVIAPGALIDAYFEPAPGQRAGALAGEIEPAPGARTLAERYAAARNFLSARPHLAHPYLPRAAAASLLVRREAFEALGGFHEGVRAAEDTDFCWRLQRAGWGLELRAGAVVKHRYRSSLTELRRQWRSYAAGRAWLARRHPGFRPQPAAARALRRLLGASPPNAQAEALAERTRAAGDRTLRDRLSFVALDALLAGEELIGLMAPNRPGVSAPPAAAGPAPVVFVAERFPGSAGGSALEPGVRVEAAARPEPAQPPPPGLRVVYREDDGSAERFAAFARLLAGHPLRCALARCRGGRAAALSALAPAALRLEREPAARLAAFGGGEASAVALARLTGRHHPAR